MVLKIFAFFHVMTAVTTAARHVRLMNIPTYYVENTVITYITMSHNTQAVSMF
jgi:hypothetical protein